MNTNITDPRFSENPFEPAELQYIFECQKDKKPFEVRKETKMQSGHKKLVVINGDFIPENYCHIWNGDNFIVHFNYEYSNKSYEGGGYAKNRFDTVESLRAEIFSAFKLTETAQISLF